MSNTDIKPKRLTKTQLLIASRHRGIIVTLCQRYYRSIPVYMKLRYELNDMIGDVIYYVTRQSYHYDRARGKESTFVWRATENKCRTILELSKGQKYTNCETVFLSPLVVGRLEVNSFEHSRISFNAVERVIKFGSDDVLDLIDVLLFGQLRTPHRTVRPTAALIREFREAAQAQNATLDDFLYVYRYVHA